jgi:hypothetical protein
MKKIFNIMMLISLLALALIISTVTVKITSAQDHPGVYFKVEPATVTKGPSPAINQTFKITVKLYNATTANVPDGLAGVEIKLTWDKTLIVPLSFNNTIATSGGVLNSPVIYGINPGFFDAMGNPIASPPYTNATSYKVAAASTAAGWNGDGIVVEIVFNVTYQGWWYQTKSCPLRLAFTDLYDVSVEPVPHEIEHGYYEILGKDPSPMPSIEVVPSTVTMGPEAVINDTFTVAVKIYDVDPGGLPSPYGIYGLEVLMTWNDTLIKPVSYQKFLGDTTTGVLNPPIFFVYDNLTDNSYWVAATSLPPASPWSGTDKKIFEITFQVVFQKVEPYPDLSSAFDITYTDIQMLPDDSLYAIYVPHTVQDGTYTILQFPSTSYYTINFGGTDYIVSINSDSLIKAPTNMGFNATAKLITFNVTTSDGFCNVTIPKSFMKSDPLTDWIIKLDDSIVVEPNQTITENTTHTFLWFNFTPGTHIVVITSTWVVPEFTNITMLLMLTVITTATIVAAAKVFKRKPFHK